MPGVATPIANAASSVNQIVCAGLAITGAKFVPENLTPLNMGHTDVYTCPPNKRAVVLGSSVSNANLSGSGYQIFFELKRSGTYYRASQTSTPIAKSVFKAYYNLHGQEQVELTGDLAAAWSKPEEYVARLALVIHCVRWAADDPGLDFANAVSVGGNGSSGQYRSIGLPKMPTEFPSKNRS